MSDARRPTLWVVLVTVGVVLLIDQLTKIWAVARLEHSSDIDVLGGVIVFTFIRNPGAAFSLGSGSTLIISLLALAIVAALLFKARQLRSVWWAVAMGGMIGGALGNLFDRVFRSPGVLRGEVVDFLYVPPVPWFNVFNVADMAVVGSAILMVVLALLGIDFDGTRGEQDAKESPKEAAPEATP